MESTSQGLVMSRATLLRGMGAAALMPFVGGALASCAPAAPPSATSGDVTFVFYGGADLQKTYNKLFEAFAKQYPKINIKAQGIGGDTWADFLNTVATRIAGGAQIDVLDVATEGQKLFAARDILQPLDAFIKKDQDVVDEYYADTPPQLREWLNTYGSPDGKTYYMPAYYNTMALQVNKKILSAAGIELPAAGWTWEEFRTAGLALKKKGVFLTTAGSGNFTDVMPWLVTNGGSTMDPKWTTPTLDTPQAVESLEYVRSLVVDGLTPKPGGTFDATTKMKQGKLASFGGGRWFTTGFQDAGIVNDVAMLPWPTNGVPGTVVGWEGWPILKNSRNKEGAWTLIKFMMSRKFQEASVIGGQPSVPGRISITESKLFTENAPENSTLLYKQLPTAVPLPAPTKGTEFARIVEQAWSQGITGAKTPQVALRDAQTKLEEVLS